MNLPLITGIRFQLKPYRDYYRTLEMGLDKFLDNNLPFYEIIYTGLKNYDPYDWLKGIDKKNLLINSLGGKDAENIRKMSKKDIENIDLNTFLPSEDNIFKAIGKKLNPS